MTSNNPQALDALATANRHRQQRRNIKRFLHSMPLRQARLEVAELLRDPPRCIWNMRVGEFLAIPRNESDKRIEDWLSRVGARWSQKVGGDAFYAIAPTQRDLLIVLLIQHSS